MSQKTMHYLQCARLMCARCAEGNVPKWLIVFDGYVHVWKIGNGHSQCGASPIWKELAARAALEEK